MWQLLSGSLNTLGRCIKIHRMEAMIMMSIRFNCPSCHTPIPLDGFEHAHARSAEFWVCPECDFVFLNADPDDLRSQEDVETDRRIEQACSTCA